MNALGIAVDYLQTEVRNSRGEDETVPGHTGPQDQAQMK